MNSMWTGRCLACLPFCVLGLIALSSMLTVLVGRTPTEIGVPNKEDAIPTPMGYSVPMAPGSQYGEIYYSGNGEARAQEVS